MEHIPIGLIEVDRCPRCGGIWLDAGELTRLKANRALAAGLDGGPARGVSRRHLIGAPRCPRDGTAMHLARDLEQAHVKVEQCAGCRGIFLDSGELRDVTDTTIREWIAGLFD